MDVQIEDTFYLYISHSYGNTMIEIICGTNRLDSITRKVGLHYQEILKTKGHESSLIDLAKLPSDFIVSALYENSGKNPAFNVFRDLIEKAGKFVFIVPEYNGSFPGVLKAFLDGMKYPGAFYGKKCALVGLSSGAQGGGLALSHLTDIFNYMGMHVLAQKPKLARIEGHMEGDNLNLRYHEMLTKQAQLLIEF